MKNLRRVLLWEMIRHYHQILFTLKCLNKNMLNSLSTDMSYIHYFLEEICEESEVRELDFAQSC